MRKGILILLTLVPIIAGYILNLTLLIPVIGMILYYLIPFLTMGFWLYLGKLYSETTWHIVPALLIGNAAGILSLLLYVWQFFWHSGDTRTLFLAALSQMFAASGPTFLTAKIAILFEPQANVFGQTTITAINIIGVGLMVLIFAAVIFGVLQTGAS